MSYLDFLEERQTTLAAAPPFVSRLSERGAPSKRRLNHAECLAVRSRFIELSVQVCRHIPHSAQSHFERRAAHAFVEDAVPIDEVSAERPQSMHS